MKYPTLLNTYSSWLGRCMEQQQVRTMLCGCDTGSTCANPFNDMTFTTDITDDSDTDSDDDTFDL